MWELNNRRKDCCLEFMSLSFIRDFYQAKGIFFHLFFLLFCLPRSFREGGRGTRVTYDVEWAVLFLMLRHDAVSFLMLLHDTLLALLTPPAWLLMAPSDTALSRSTSRKASGVERQVYKALDAVVPRPIKISFLRKMIMIPFALICSHAHAGP